MMMTTPPPGQALTAETVKLLVKGDLLRCERWNGEMFTAGREYEVVSKDADGDVVLISDEAEAIALGLIDQFTFVRRPTHPCYDEHQPGCDCAVPEETVARSKPPHLGRLASQSTAPTPPEPVASALAEGEGLEVVARVYNTIGGEPKAIMDKHDRFMSGQGLVTAEAAAARIAELEAQNDVLRVEVLGLRAAIFGSHDYDPSLRHASFIEMARTTEDARQGAVNRATQAEARADRLAKALGDIGLTLRGFVASLPDDVCQKHSDSLIEVTEAVDRANASIQQEQRS